MKFFLKIQGFWLVQKLGLAQLIRASDWIIQSNDATNKIVLISDKNFGPMRTLDRVATEFTEVFSGFEVVTKSDFSFQLFDHWNFLYRKFIGNNFETSQS